MTNTLAALHQFTQALGPMLPPSVLNPDSPRHPEPAPPGVHIAAPAPGAEQCRPTAKSRDGITRQAPWGDWPRRLRLAVLSLTMALGFTHAVRATEGAAGSYWRQAVANSLAAPHAGRVRASPLRTTPRRSG